MRSKQKFFICQHCGNLLGLIVNKGVPVVCCGEKMTELIPNTAEASTEKHLPDVKVTGDLVSVRIGTVAHPMEEAHSIMFVYMETKQGGQRKALKAGEEPRCDFFLVNDEALAVYAYCNLHGLWKTEL